MYLLYTNVHQQRMTNDSHDTGCYIKCRIIGHCKVKQWPNIIQGSVATCLKSMMRPLIRTGFTNVEGE